MIRKFAAAAGAAVLATGLGMLASAGPASAATPAARTAAGVFRDGNWAGHIVGLNAQGQSVHGQFTEEEAAWQVPTLACSLYNDLHHDSIGVWAGLGGAVTNPLVQTGEQDKCSLSGQQDQAWWEVVVSSSTYPPVFLSASTYPVDPGDSMFAEVFYAGGGIGDTYSIYLADSTQGWHFGLNCPSAACVANGAAVSIPSGYPATGEAVVERFTGKYLGELTYPLPDFGTIPFSDVRYDYHGSTPPGGFPVYVLEPPQYHFLPPEIYVQRGLLHWAATWELPFF